MPAMTRSIRIAFEDLGLTRVFVVYPGSLSYTIDSRNEALAIRDLPARLVRVLPAPLRDGTCGDEVG
jgi:hypothetical protein